MGRDESVISNGTAIPLRAQETLSDSNLPEARFLLRIKPSLDRLSKADPGNVQEVVASQIALMSVYHGEVIDQARRSFRWALIAAITGFVCFALAIVLFLSYQFRDVAILSAISGGIIEVISTVNFYLYSKASAQMAEFQHRLDLTQRYLLANSICEALKGEVRQRTRSELVRAIAGICTVGEDQGEQT